ncbi:MAG: DUF262 domain-containing HNH endonuclease family protein [Deltaproteobacteria bacterium]|jgi:hypothetical protein|nr:DUF262 domain-containing HNH endonuclease family protein [Deltaproteobacteria bacterium]
MKAIQATPKEIQKVFSDSYLIPNFQRPYSWEREHCENLWTDIIAFHDDVHLISEDKYFLGNIVVHLIPSGQYSVIDGQQRLTTLLLLIKALFTRAGTLKTLEKCLRVEDKLTSELTDKLRIHSEVIEQDNEILNEIILRSVPDSNGSKMVVNYRNFCAWIDDWHAIHSGADDLNGLISTILYKVVLLPIECDSEDDALSIFETINNRGMSLTDADIFKAKLYNKVPSELQKSFIEDWRALNVPDVLFRSLMHVIRADNSDTKSEIGLRKYFATNDIFSDWRGTMASLKKIHDIENVQFNTEITCLKGILSVHINETWRQPFHIFMHKYAFYNEEGMMTISPEHEKELTVLFEEMVRYYFIKGVVYNSVSAVKDTTYKVYGNIARGGDYLSEFQSSITDFEKLEMVDKLDKNLLSRMQRGVVLLASYLNPAQDKVLFSQLDFDKFHIEHILPQKWNNYDGWNEEKIDKQLNSLGNLIPLEKKLNISASNEFLKRKKAIYKYSKIQDAHDIIAIVPDNGWKPKKVEEFTKAKNSRLKEFFKL